MSTNATISYFNKTTGDFQQIYLHWDGYLSWAGQILLDYYDSADRAKALMALGDLSSIGKYIEPSPLVELLGMDGASAYTAKNNLEDFDTFAEWMESIVHSPAFKKDSEELMPAWDKYILEMMFYSVKAKTGLSFDPLIRLDNAYTKAYGRDRNEENVEAKLGNLCRYTGATLDEELLEIARTTPNEFNYIYVDSDSATESGWYMIEHRYDEGLGSVERLSEDLIAAEDY